MTFQEQSAHRSIEQLMFTQLMEIFIVSVKLRYWS